MRRYWSKGNCSQANNSRLVLGPFTSVLLESGGPQEIGGTWEMREKSVFMPGSFSFVRLGRRGVLFLDSSAASLFLPLTLSSHRLAFTQDNGG